MICVASPAYRRAFDEHFSGGDGYGVWEEVGALHTRIGERGHTGVAWLLLGHRTAADIPDRYRSQNRPEPVKGADVTGLLRWIRAKARPVDPATAPGGWEPRTAQVSPLMPRRNPHFVGREEELNRMAALWHDGGHAASVVYESIVGNGGIGKSELAIEYAYRCLDEHTADWVGWVLGDAEDNFVNQLCQLGTWRGISRRDGEVPTAFAGRVVAALEQTPDRWLLIVDNAEPEVESLGLLPKLGNGQTVLTSRSAQVADRISALPVDLDVLPLGEAVTLLQKGAPSSVPAGELESIAEKVGCLPLALDIAAALLRNGEAADGVLRRLPKVRARRRETTIDALWTATLERLSPEATRLLRLICTCAPDRVPVWALATATLDPPLSDFEAARDELADWSLIDVVSERSVSNAGPVVSVHRLLRAVVNGEISVSGSGAPDALRAATDAIAMLDAALTGDATHPDSWPLMVALEPHVLEVYSEVALSHVGVETARCLLRIADRIATARQYSGDVPAAPELFENVLADLVELLGERHPDTLTAKNNLAFSLRALGDTNTAADLQRQVLADLVELFGERHPDTLTAKNNLASSLRALGDANTAADLQRHVLADSIELLGERHPHTLTAKHHLANSLRALGDANTAADLQQQVLADRVKLLGERHPDTLRAMHDLAHSLWELGHHDEALEVMRSAVQGRLLILPDHPDTRSSEVTLAAWMASHK